MHRAYTILLGLCLGWKGQCICCVTSGREGGREGRERGRERERGGGREGGREGWREGGMTVTHIIIMAPQYLNNNHVT